VTAIAALAVALVLLPVSRTPEAFPQQPDTIFHLGAAQWMAEHYDPPCAQPAPTGAGHPRDGPLELLNLVPPVRVASLESDYCAKTWSPPPLVLGEDRGEVSLRGCLSTKDVRRAPSPFDALSR